jgi:hypothetical protein
MITRRMFFLRAGTAIALISINRDALARSLKTTRSGFPHPDPRPGITGENVLAESELGKSRRVREAYAAAREHPELFDGVYCACHCDKSMNHRSLLSCFESRQAIGCLACREEAELVARMAGEGKSLEEIRIAVDKEFAD